MATEDRVKVLEDEFKLIKSELRQTLIGVRDFLLDMKLPASQDETNSPAKKPQIESMVTESIPANMPANPPAVENLPQHQPGFEVPERATYTEPSASIPPTLASPPQPVNQVPNHIPVEVQFPEDNNLSANLEMPFDIDTEVADVASGDIPVKEPAVMEGGPKEAIGVGIQPGTPTAPQVNVLANLIRWVAMARKEIGAQQLPVFLDIYAASGNLSSEMKKEILHLAEIVADPSRDSEGGGKIRVVNEQMEICMEISSSTGQLPEEVKANVRRLTELILQQTVYSNKADIWSRLLLELHGVLTGAGSSLQPITINNSETVEEGAGIVEVKEVQPDSEAVPMEEAPVEESPAVNPTDGSEEEPFLPKGRKPARLRLVLPIDENNEQELDLGSLFISTDFPQRKGNGHRSQPVTEE